jgi:hypothetical protein
VDDRAKIFLTKHAQHNLARIKKPVTFPKHEAGDHFLSIW